MAETYAPATFTPSGCRFMTSHDLTTWAVSTQRRRPGDLLTRADVCHLHEDRVDAERCGALLEGVPDLVRLENQSERVYRVLWSLSEASGGELRRVAPAPVQTPFDTARLAQEEG